MENINLIRSIAWSYHKTTGLPYEDLYSEASLGYCEALNKYKPTHNCKLTSYAYRLMKNKLTNFVNKEMRYVVGLPEIEISQQHEKSFSDIIEDWPEDCQLMVHMIIKHENQFFNHTPNFKRKYITGRNHPRKRVYHFFKSYQRWKPQRISKCMDQISTILN